MTPFPWMGGLRTDLIELSGMLVIRITRHVFMGQSAAELLEHSQRVKCLTMITEVFNYHLCRVKHRDRTIAFGTISAGHYLETGEGWKDREMTSQSQFM